MKWAAGLGPGGDLPSQQRVRLTDSLFEQSASMIQGTVALLIVQALCVAETHSAEFMAGGLATVAVLAARLRLAARYRRRRPASPLAGWVRWFTAGGVFTGLIWGATTFHLAHDYDEPRLLMIAIAVEAGWIAGLAVRNAGSTAAVFWQSTAAGIPASAAFLLSDSLLLHLGAFLFPFQIYINMGIARYLRGQTLEVLRSEQALAEANAALNLTCAELEDANVRLQRLSATDELTRIGNRRAFEAVLQTEWTRAVRDGGLLSLLMLDVDLFKAFNDRYGHTAGDDGLRLVATLAQAALRRATDFAGRFGGEEFVVLLPGVDADGAAAVAERLRSDVAEAALAHESSPLRVLTVSIGVATAAPLPAEPSRGLVDAADRALYRAKQSGRNRVERACEGEHILREAPARV